MRSALSRALDGARRRPLASVSALAFAVQLAAATWWLKPYVMPNMSLVIAYNVAASGRYEGGSWARLKGTILPSDPPLRSYHLPGEPLYLAAGLALRRPAIFAYWHVPVAVLLVFSIAASALSLFGPEVALVAGVIAALDPVTVVHGAVYDDAFLGAALLWTVAAILLRRWVAAGRGHPADQTGEGPVTMAVLAVAAGWAAITRTELMLALGATAICCVVIPRLRPLRRAGAIVGTAVIVAVGAWTIRNAVIQHDLMTGSTHDGLTLWESTGPQAARALAYGQVDALSTDPAIVGSLWQQTIGRDEAGANRVFLHAAFRQIVDQPMRVAGLAARKTALSVAGWRPELPASSARNLVSIAVTILLVGVAGLGWRRTKSAPDPVRRLPAIAAALLGAEILCVLALGPVGIRYWVVWRPVLWILAGCALALPHWVGALRATPQRVST
jgi:hypothetical protein